MIPTDASTTSDKPPLDPLAFKGWWDIDIANAVKEVKGQTQKDINASHQQLYWSLQAVKVDLEVFALTTGGLALLGATLIKNPFTSMTEVAVGSLWRRLLGWSDAKRLLGPIIRSIAPDAAQQDFINRKVESRLDDQDRRVTARFRDRDGRIRNLDDKLDRFIRLNNDRANWYADEHRDHRTKIRIRQDVARSQGEAITRLGRKLGAAETRSNDLADEARRARRAAEDAVTKVKQTSTSLGRQVGSLRGDMGKARGTADKALNRADSAHRRIDGINTGLRNQRDQVRGLGASQVTATDPKRLKDAAEQMRQLESRVNSLVRALG